MSIAEIYQKFKTCSGVSTDTRNIQPGVLFFALKGDNFNANEFAHEALSKGASYVIIDEEKYATNENCILVGNVLYTLQELANFHRKQFNIPVIGMTGSNGKTTSKELVAAVLSKKYNTYYTKGNLNNHIGVPLTLLGLNSSHEIAVIEMGANHQGEIRDLCNICEPTHGFITNIGKAHLEGFGGIEGVKKGKGELFDFISKSGGTVFINAQNQTLEQLASSRFFREKVSYLNDNTYQLVEESPLVVFSHNQVLYKTHLPGSYNFENIATALAVGHYFQVPSELCHEAVCAYNPDNNRSQIVEQGSNKILLDAYNANPSSMAASLANFGKLITDKQKVVILGDMFELGEDAPVEHELIGKLIASSTFDLVVLFGPLMSHALKYLPNAFYFTDKFSLHNWLQDKKLENSFVLIKGSRGVKLETVLPFLK